MKKEFKKNEYYFLKIKHLGREIEYICQILEISEKEIMIRDQNNSRLKIKRSQIFKSERISREDFNGKYDPIEISTKVDPYEKILEETK